MAKRFKYIRQERDQNGNYRVYFQRHRRGRKIRVHETPGTQGFMNVYQQLLLGAENAPRPATHLDQKGFVYFLQAGGDIKIGFSTEPASRVQGLKTGLPVAIELLVAVPGTRRDEQSLHRLLSTDRLSGEWFKASRKVRAVMVKSVTTGRPATEEEQASPEIGGAAIGTSPAH